MLLDQAFDLQKCGEEVPFIFGGVDGVCEGFVAVERLKESVKALRMSASAGTSSVGVCMGGRTSGDGTFGGIEGCG